MPRSPLDAFRAFGPKLLGLSLVGGLLLAGAMLPFVGGVGLFAKSSINDFENQSCELGDTKPPQTSVIKASDGGIIGNLYLQNRIVVPAAEIPDTLKKAVVAIEDRRFYQHNGVDIKGTLRALVSDVTSGNGSQQGGSTLTQQYVKQARLYSASSQEDQKKAVERTASRKLSEARCALAIEKRMSKDEIVSAYLNIANFGAGAYGVGVAAKTYFNTTADKLTLSQSALLAAVVNLPSGLDPYKKAEAAKQRRHDVLHDMQELNYISQEDADKADKEELVPTSQRAPKPPNGCANANKNIANAGFFCDYVTKYLAEHANLSLRDLQTGGYTIETTLDPRMQAATQAAIDAHVGRTHHATAVTNVIDPKTGDVKAMGVGRTYGTDPKDPAQTVLPLATQPIAGAGSTYKLFTTIAALRDHFPLRGQTITTENNEYQPVNCGADKKKITNAGNYPSTLNLEDALYRSSNTFFEALIDQRFNCDLTKPVEAAIQLGMSNVKERKDQIINGKEISLTLGPDSTSVMELTSAYGAIDNSGILCPARPITKITGPDGKIVPLQLPSCQQAVEPGIANTIVNALKKDTDPSAPGSTAKAAHLTSYPTAGKTGTTQNNAAAWFIGFTPQYVAGTSMFNPDSSSSRLTDVPGFIDGEIFGGTVGAKIFHDAMTKIMQGQPVVQFPAEDPMVVNGDMVQVPNVIGQDLQTATNTLQAAGFVAQVGQGKESAQPVDTVAETSPTGFAKAGETITIIPSLGQPSATPTPSVPPGLPEFPPGFPSFPTDTPTDPTQQPGPPGRNREPAPTPTP